MRGIQRQILLGMLGWGNLMGMLLVSSDVHRHGTFGVASVLDWFGVAVFGGAAFGALTHVFTRNQSLLRDEPRPRVDAVDQALRSGRLDVDPELRRLELGVAAQRYRSRLQIAGLVIVTPAIPPLLYFWITVFEVDEAPTGYWVLLATSIALITVTYVVGLVLTIRRNPALERILAQQYEAEHLDAG